MNMPILRSGLLAGVFLCQLTMAIASEEKKLAAEADREKQHSYVPEQGFVPSSEVAIKIAVAVWGPIYGEKEIAAQKPYSATLTDDVWVVKGQYNGRGHGGAAIAEISKLDGRVIRVSHTK